MKGIDIRQCRAMKGDTLKLMDQCLVAVPGHPGSVVEVRRGMVVKCIEGKQAGKVAAVAVGPGNLQARCLILGHLPEKAPYQSLPAAWIDRVDGDVIYLNVGIAEVQGLPEWHPV